MKYILSIDQGTTGSRAIVYDKNGKIVTSAYQEFPQYFPKPGWVEHNAEEIWESVNSSIQKVLKKIPAKSIAAIGITNQRDRIHRLRYRRTHNSYMGQANWQART